MSNGEGKQDPKRKKQGRNVKETIDS